MVRIRRTQSGKGLTPIMFQILVALAEEDRHGYGIMREIQNRSHGELELGAGTLYRSLRQLKDAGFIEETESARDHSQRRTYRLTQKGRQRATQEARSLDGLLTWARSADLLDGGKA